MKDSSALVVIGGLHTINTDQSTLFSTQIQYCTYSMIYNFPFDCRILGLELPTGLIEPRVVSLSFCKLVVVGGRNKTDGVSRITDYMGIADVCTEEWLYEGTIPEVLTEFTLIAINDALCIYGGLGMEGDISKASNKVYCTGIEYQ